MVSAAAAMLWERAKTKFAVARTGRPKLGQPCAWFKMDELFGSDDEDDVPNTDMSVAPQTRIYGEIRHMEDVGGSRGVFATTDLEAGCLICAEKPYITWPHGTEFGDVDSLATIILQIVNTPAAWECSKVLYPGTLDACVPDECKEVRLLFEVYDAADLNRLALEANVSLEEVIRIALVLQHNGFNSGLYEKQCMLNHSCVPNCIKLIPPGKHSASEIWTTRPVRTGEELVICYFSPMESASRTMRDYLRTNHRFECRCAKCTSTNTVNDNGEVYPDVLFEEKIMAIEGRLAEQKQRSMRSSDPATLTRLLSDAKGCLQEHEAVLTEEHALLARVCKAVIAAVLLCLDWCGEHNTPVEEAQATAFVTYNIKLLAHQRLYLGTDHPDIGATLGDLCEGIQSLKQRFPRSLASHFALAQWTSVVSDSGAHSSTAVVAAAETAGAPAVVPTGAAAVTQCIKYCQAEARRIKALYSTAVKCPAAMQLLKAPPGAHYWGSAPNT